jgi:hypothetical protein
MKTNLEGIIKKHLKLIAEGEDMEQENYMFFKNITQMKRQCDLLMKEDHSMIDNILKEHDWAQDHISEAKSLLDQVFDFLMNKTAGQEMGETYLNEEYQIDESENCPTDPAKWSASKSAAKAKFDVYPSAYANGWAAKNYKAKGGGWKKCKK